MNIQYVELDSDLPLGPVPCVVENSWSGWAVPWFAWREVQEIGAELMEHADWPDLTDGINDGPNSLALTSENWSEQQEWRVFPDGVTRWQVGAGWPWLVVDEEGGA